jgi:hypothetical protein
MSRCIPKVPYSCTYSCIPETRDRIGVTFSLAVRVLVGVIRVITPNSDPHLLCDPMCGIPGGGGSLLL